MAFLLSTLLFLAVSPAAEKTPKEVVLAPSSPWNVQYEAESCSMIRSFGSDESKLTLQFDQYSPSPVLRPFFTGTAIKSLNGFEKIDLLIGDRIIKSSEYYRYIVAPEKFDKIFIASLIPIYPQAEDRPAPLQGSVEADAIEQGLTSISLDIKSRHIITLQTGSLHKPLKAMRACIDDMMRQWGYDPVQFRKPKSRPKPRGNPSDWLRSDDYPSNAQSNAEDGIIVFRLHVDETGKPTRCVVQASIGNQDFAKRSCALVMRRADFDPAVDANGKPMAAPYFQHLVWQIPS